MAKEAGTTGNLNDKASDHAKQTVTAALGYAALGWGGRGDHFVHLGK